MEEEEEATEEVEDVADKKDGAEDGREGDVANDDDAAEAVAVAPLPLGAPSAAA